MGCSLTGQRKDNLFPITRVCHGVHMQEPAFFNFARKLREEFTQLTEMKLSAEHTLLFFFFTLIRFKSFRYPTYAESTENYRKI